MTVLKNADLDALVVTGDLAVRSLLNYARLEGTWYRPWEVFGADKHGWPGDWEGRVILGLVSQARATHRTPAWLEMILEELPKRLNAKGYLGKICAEGWANEQQLAGHSWLVRGLIAAYERQPDAKLKDVITTIMRNLFLPVATNYANYPLTLEQVVESDQWELSHPQSKTPSHKGSIDTGCGFIALDGLTDAYRFLGWSELKTMIEVVIQRFLLLDLEQTKTQTHATLTCLRGLCRYVELGGSPEYVVAAERIFGRYKAVAMTEHFGNYNWWGRPRWTEPCAIIDSYILSHWLWRLTRKPEYQTDAHHIFYNGVGHAFRAEGCFGTDWCLGAVPPEEDDGPNAHDPRILQPRSYEVYWCCTMRGGEFFARAHEAAFATDGNNIWLPIFHNATVKIAGLSLREKTAYPCQGEVTLDVLAAEHETVRAIRFFIPPRTSCPVVLLNGVDAQTQLQEGFIEVIAEFRAGDVLRYTFDIQMKCEQPHNENTVRGLHAFFHGPLLLALEQKAPERYNPDEPTAPSVLDALPPDTAFEPAARGKYRMAGTEQMLAPIYDIENLTQRWHARQALFNT
ncbi:MAG: hypothetical protein WCP12_08200 [bacterium]